MKKKDARELDLKKLLKWLGDDPHQDAKLIEEVPMSASTLGRIKSGSYKPSPILTHAIMAVIEKD